MSKSDFAGIKSPTNLRLITELANDPNAPGEFGKGVTIDSTNLTGEAAIRYKKGFEITSYNEYVSDMISTRRRLPDYRDPGCKVKTYAEELPTTSVILIFHNEALSTLLRSVYSIIDRTDPKLLKEIILVDDFSNRAGLGQELDDYIKDLEKVRVLRLKKREGLIRARLAGAKVAKGQVLTFFDSHIECTEGWLEPMLGEIHRDKKTVPQPSLDDISHDTFAFQHIPPKEIGIGAFAWNMHFYWMNVPERENQRRKNDNLASIQSPVMVGGMFSIDRKYFYEIGSYDEGMDIWGRREC
ncbi:hypothetical protein EB796_007278 [Bugula neritina]|uniref:Glycosyltransferase 2-like domain-containing protein n=1 Tax=Bugula neritina TaxID=10212 RepID=A0A7J7K981_BUGNE|nr:hypothetical protein EB796_007278 [Bugula neritina]